jgi:VanZ like family
VRCRLGSPAAARPVAPSGRIDGNDGQADNVRHIGSLVDARVIVVAVVLTAVCGWTARLAARRTGAMWTISFAALLSLALIAALTVANRGVVISREKAVAQVTWWAKGWGRLPSVFADLGWWMNVVLFVPAGVLWTAVTNRPLRIVLYLAALSFAIETAHAMVLAGIGDPTDLIANVAGGTLGSLVGIAVARPVDSAAVGVPR